MVRRGRGARPSCLSADNVGRHVSARHGNHHSSSGYDPYRTDGRLDGYDDNPRP